MKMLFISLLSMMSLVSCTYNVSMSHTDGGSTDTMDENAANTPTVTPTVNIPVTPGAGFGLGK